MVDTVLSFKKYKLDPFQIFPIICESNCVYTVTEYY